MKVIELHSKEATDLIKSCLLNNSLVPIIGAGFTMGCKSKAAKVPNGNEFKKIMIDSIINNSERLKGKRDLLEKRDFKGVSEIYLNGKDVPRKIVKQDIQKYFLEVEIPHNKKEFLKAGWPYIYTFNVDDGIEKNSNYKPVLPYLKISAESKEIRCVYKVHGDASHEVIYDEGTSLIFSSSQYVRSLIKNESMILFLRNDLYENNIMFVGCSLDNEIDLMYAIIGVDEKPVKESSRIYVTRSKPSELDEIDLENYNINVVLLVDDYDNFYQQLCDISKSIVTSTVDPLLEYSANKIKMLPKSKDKNIDYLLRADASLSKDQHYTKPYYIIERERKTEILKSVLDNTLTIIKGRRFSGKTLLLQDIATTIKNKEVYYFPSVITISDEIFEKMIDKKNCIYIFDTNVLDFEKCLRVRRSFKNLRDNSINILIACNPSEIDVANTFLAVCEENSFFELDNKLTKKEVDQLNKKLSEMGIINWINTKNILDNTYLTHETYPEKTPNIVKSSQFSDDEIKAIIIISTFDKAYSAISRILNLHLKDVQTLAQKLHPLVEVDVISTIEFHHHSKYKVMANSKSWLFKVANEYYKKHGNLKIVSIMVDLVKTFMNYNEYKNIADKIIMFDNLNQVFSGSKGGAAHLILALYQELQPILFENPDYWLQRAKAILKLENRSDAEVIDGIDYAKKAYTDGKRDKTVNNAEFTIALLYGKLCKNANYSNIDNVVEGIDWFHNAISNHQHNREYIESMLEASRGRHGYFYFFCKNLVTQKANIRLLEKKDKIQSLLRYSSLSA